MSNNNQLKGLQLLDTTLRDGSYVVDFQLTAQDTALIAAALDANNVPFIEVGHGVGMNASANPRMAAACSDDEYMRATASAVKQGKWGMFFIPGIGRMEDVERAAANGMDFIRIGTNVTEVPQSQSFIARAKQLGMFVSANFMKTYAATPDEVGRYAKQSMEYGADIVCVVDSAGGMFPEDVDAYFEGIRKHTDVPIGFHGHNNLGLAIANTLRAVELGAAIVDTSMRGMGRSAGNASTEILLLALRRRGIDLGIDPLRIMTVAEQRIDPMLRNYPQVDSIGIVSGYAQFHSSFLGTILDQAERHSVDPRELILHVTQADKVNAPPALVERLARELAGQGRVPRRISVPGFSTAVGTGTGDLAKDAGQAATESRVLARKFGKVTVFDIVQAYRAPRSKVSSTVVDGPQYVVASAEVCNKHDAGVVARAVDGIAELILLDADHKSDWSEEVIAAVMQGVTKSRVLRHSDLSAWGRSVVAMVFERLGARTPVTSVLVVGDNHLARVCRAELELRGIRSNDSAAVAAIVCQTPAEGQLAGLQPRAVIVDALIGALSPTVVEECRSRGFEVFRPDMRASIHAEVALLVGTATLAREQGIADINGVAVAAGGALAPHGTVIVDSVRAPTRVFGVADGGGLLLQGVQLTPELRRRVETVEAAVASTLA